MTSDPISPSVRRFIADHLRSLEQLEVLLLLARADERWWSAEGVGTELGIAARAAEKRLEQLASHNLVDVRVADTVLFRYHPTSAEMAARVRDVAKSYAEHRLVVINAIPAQESMTAREFADAFRIRTRRRDG